MEVGLAQRVVRVADPSAVGEARQRAAGLAAKLAFDPTAAGELAIAVTEAAGNIVKHAGEGLLLLRPLERAGAAGVEVLAIDKGPGMRNVAECLRDGYSTAGSPGTGLGALQRMTRHLDIWSAPGLGTMLRFEVWPRKAGVDAETLCTGAICVPKPGEDESGDGWVLLGDARRLSLLVVDGLGHGPAAATAARTAVAAARKEAARDPVDMLDAVHAALRPTRGAAAAVARVEPDKELCVFCGVGNISAAVRADGRMRTMVSHNGILGHQVRKFQEFRYPFPRRALLLAHSDGVGTHWDLDKYPGLQAHHPSLVAAALYRDHARGRDDATVVAVRLLERTA